MVIKKQRVELILKDRSKLYGLSWTNDEPIKGNVIIVTGMEETSSRYHDFAMFLCKNNFNVYCIDMFGQGENVNKDKSNLGIWPTSGFRKMVQAIDDLVALLRLSMVPIYIFSHSMGSFICQDFIQRYPEHVSKVVLCGSGSKNPAVPFGFMLSKMIVKAKNRDKKSKILAKLMFGGFNKKIENPRTEYDWLSYNQANVDSYIADPLCGFGPNNGFCYEFLKGLNRLYKDKFLKLREDFNNSKDIGYYHYAMLYTLILYSFNNQIRFNSNGHFNLPVGKRDYNEKMKQKLQKFIDRLKGKDYKFSNLDFRDFDISTLNSNSFVYADPPYLVTTATYNEKHGWTESDETSLHELLESLTERGIRFALSNTLRSRGKENSFLIGWLEKHPEYRVLHLDRSYANSSYHIKDREAESDEVLILNY